MRRAPAILSFLLAVATVSSAASMVRQKAVELYAQDKPAEAKPLLEAALNEDPTDTTIYLYLGIVNQQLRDYQKAIAVLKRGLSFAQDNRELFYDNIGNNFFSEGEFTFAEEMYGNAITANRRYPLAYLNRAQCRMQLENYSGAVADYTVFLQLQPQDPQRPKIEAVIAAINKLLDAQAKKQKDEEAKQKALMNEVLNSLNNASEDTKNLSVESLQFKRETEDVDIKD
jgi:tetratricopeptide (TPR) repeat protein